MLTITSVKYTCKGVSITKVNLFVNPIEFTCAFWGSRRRVFVFPFLTVCFGRTCATSNLSSYILPVFFFNVCLRYLSNSQHCSKVFVTAPFLKIAIMPSGKEKKKKKKRTTIILLCKTMTRNEINSKKDNKKESTSESVRTATFS